jgi:hypothetical protein
MAKLENLGNCAGCPALDYCNSLLLDVARAEFVKEKREGLTVPDSPMLASIEPATLEAAQQSIRAGIVEHLGDVTCMPSILKRLMDLGLDAEQSVEIFRNILDGYQDAETIEQGKLAQQTVADYNMTTALQECTEGVRYITVEGIGMIACGSPMLTDAQRQESMLTAPPEA